MADPDEVARLYDAAPERELHRLDERRVEFGVTCRALEEFLPPPPATILDVGSGPGRYAFYLISRGYSVSLVDVSRECLSLAEREAARLDLPLGDVVHGDATDLSSFSEAVFDAVLSLGPLYHLKGETARERAVKEALRVVRPGGIIFSAFLNRYSAVRYAAKKRPEQFLEDPELIGSILSTGTGESSRADAAFLCSCYFSDPLEVQPFMERLGVTTVELLGCEGVVAEVEEKLNVLAEPELDSWVDLNYDLGRRRELHASSAHLLHVGRKPASPL